MHVYGQLLKAQLENTTSDPTKRGEINFNTNDSVAKYHDGTSARALVDTDKTQTVSNKTLSSCTIDADSNSVSNIDNGNVKSGADIARNKLASGTADHVVINDGSGVMSSEAQLAISRGGTGQSTQTDAMDALSPTTTKGDLLVDNGTNVVRVGVGSDGTVLKANSSQSAGVEWASAAANLAVRTVTTTDSPTVADDLLLCNASGGAFTITLPTASGNAGKALRFKKIGTDFNAVTIDGNSSETIDGATTFVLYSPTSTITIVSDGTNWAVIDKKLNLARASVSSTNAIGTGTPVGVSGGSVLLDNHSSMASGVFTAKKPMTILQVGGVAVVGGAGSLELYKNGSAYKRMGQNQGGAGTIGGNIIAENVVVGDTFEVRHSSGGVTANPAYAWFLEVE